MYCQEVISGDQDLVCQPAGGNQLDCRQLCINQGQGRGRFLEAGGRGTQNTRRAITSREMTYDMSRGVVAIVRLKGTQWLRQGY